MKFPTIALLLMLISCNSGKSKPVNTLKDISGIEAYQPKRPVDFPHEIHAKNQINCNYCHNPKVESDRHELTVNICTNCHKKIYGADADTTQ